MVYATIKHIIPSNNPFVILLAKPVFTNPMSLHLLFVTRKRINKITIPKILCIKFSANTVSSVLIKKYSIILAMTQTINIPQHTTIECFFSIFI